jgi:hypothetical protein
VDHRSLYLGGAEVEDVLSRASYYNKKYDLDMVVFDPYNMFDHNNDGRNTAEYVSGFSNKLNDFAELEDVSVILVAHQVTVYDTSSRDKDGNPKPLNRPPVDMYKIRGGGNFADKFDFVYCYQRPYVVTDEQHPKVTMWAGRLRDQDRYGIRKGLVELAWDKEKFRLLEVSTEKTQKELWYDSSDMKAIEDGEAPHAIPKTVNHNDLFDEYLADLLGVERDGAKPLSYYNNARMKEMLGIATRKERKLTGSLCAPSKHAAKKDMVVAEAGDCPF